LNALLAKFATGSWNVLRDEFDVIETEIVEATKVFLPKEIYFGGMSLRSVCIGCRKS
jgi:hypothetical protein